MKNILFFQDEDNIKVGGVDSENNNVIETTTEATIDEELVEKLEDSAEIQLYTTEEPSNDTEEAVVDLDMEYPNITSMVEFNALMQKRVNNLRFQCSDAPNNLIALHANYLYVLKVSFLENRISYILNLQNIHMNTYSQIPAP